MLLLFIIMGYCFSYLYYKRIAYYLSIYSITMMALLHYPNIIQIIVINEELWWASFSNIIYEIVLKKFLW
jgi:hypothetical protein